MNLNKPLKLNEQLEIVDAGGSIVIPCISWSGDIPHINQQRERGKLIVALLNSYDENSGEILKEPKKRGNPAFQKGSKNPYMGENK